MKTFEKERGKNLDVAVRSSATAEDLHGARFAGEHESYLGIRGGSRVALAMKVAMASLFTDRAISYRMDKGFAHTAVALCVSVGSKIASGAAHIIMSPKHVGEFKEGEILVTDITDPDWEPIMKIAAAIGTNKGGRTSHAAIVSRELGAFRMWSAPASPRNA